MSMNMVNIHLLGPGQLSFSTQLLPDSRRFLAQKQPSTHFNGQDLVSTVITTPVISYSGQRFGQGDPQTLCTLSAAQFALTDIISAHTMAKHAIKEFIPFSNFFFEGKLN